MRGLLLSVDEKLCVLQTHPLFRRYLQNNHPLGVSLHELIQSKPELAVLASAIHAVESKNTAGANFELSLHELEKEFSHYQFNSTIRITLQKMQSKKPFYFFFVEDISELEKVFSLLRKKEELFNRSVHFLKEISHIMLSEPASKVAARKSIKKICELFHADAAIIRLYTKNKTLKRYVSCNLDGDYVAEYLEIDPRDVPFYAQALSGQRTLISDEIGDNFGTVKAALQKRFDRLLVTSTPIIQEDEITGMLSILFSDPNFDLISECEDILDNLSHELNFMLEKGDFFMQLLDRTEELRSLNINIVTALSDAIETRDPYTKGHSERVATYAVEIARNYGWDDYEIERVRTAGILHDIGKVGIPDAVLLKPGNLSKREYDIMKLHPEMSAAIVTEIESFSDLVPWIRYHHENFDGSGYPYGLAGNDIPLGSRIIAVADAFDAMTSDRPYRKGLPINQVRAIFEEGAGSQWDPEVVAVALDNLEIIYDQSASFFHIPEVLDGFRKRIFNMNLMDGLYLFEYVYDQAVQFCENEQNFQFALISVKKPLLDLDPGLQKRNISILIDIIKQHIHFPLLVSRYDYFDFLIFSPDGDHTLVRRLMNRVMMDFFQKTGLFFATNSMTYPSDCGKLDNLIQELLRGREDIALQE